MPSAESSTICPRRTNRTLDMFDRAGSVSTFHSSVLRTTIAVAIRIVRRWRERSGYGSNRKRAPALLTDPREGEIPSLGVVVLVFAARPTTWRKVQAGKSLVCAVP